MSKAQTLGNVNYRAKGTNLITLSKVSVDESLGLGHLVHELLRPLHTTPAMSESRLYTHTCNKV
jgi:hypothetical protein